MRHYHVVVIKQGREAIHSVGTLRAVYRLLASWGPWACRCDQQVCYKRVCHPLRVN